MTSQRDAVFQASSTANLNVCSNYTMVTDANVFIEFSARVDHCCMGDYSWHEKVPERVRLVGWFVFRAIMLHTDCALAPASL
jgi:hypothetical protein